MSTNSVNQELAVVVKELKKSFVLPHEKYSGLKQAAINIFRPKSGYEKQKVLDGVSFEIKKGEFFGIVGRNGSGKSTLLKLLAGIYAPDEGLVQVNGSLTPFIELGVGFNMELTGRENVFMNGALLGFDRKQMLEMYDDIVTFAELENFMDQKLKNYSSGMQVRLAFSIAIRAESDILLIDEVLAVGDAAFQQKCYEMFREIQSQGRTVILVTHDMSAVLRFCDRAMLVDKGEVKIIGSSGKVADKYLELNYDQDSNQEHETEQNHQVSIQYKGAFDSENRKVSSISSLSSVRFRFQIDHKLKGQNIHLGFQIFNEKDNYCFGTNTKISDLEAITSNSCVAEINIDQNLTPGRYYINMAVLNETAEQAIYYKPRIHSFSVKQDTKFEGVSLMKHKWSIKNV